MRLECNVCKLITHADTQELAESFRLEHSHKLETSTVYLTPTNGGPVALYDGQKWVKPDVQPEPDEFGEIFKEEKRLHVVNNDSALTAVVTRLDEQDKKDREEFAKTVFGSPADANPSVWGGGSPAPFKPVEMVNHPAHYNQTSVECIQIIEELGLNFNLGNALKYLWRSESKGKKKEDLEKCIWYLRRELDHDTNQ